MNLITQLLIHGVLAVFTTPFNISFTTIDRKQHSVGDFRGQKIWIIVLPATQAHAGALFLNGIDSIALARIRQIKTIAAPSFEDGYSNSVLATLQPFYQGLLDSSVSITQGIYTHQSSGHQLNTLFSWLADASRNSYFQQKVGGAGEMYFIDEQGGMYGMYGPGHKI